MVHLCHHPTCKRAVPPKMLACRAHWFALPKQLRDRIWATYREGQEIDKNPSDAYSEAFDECQRWWRESLVPAAATTGKSVDVLR